MPCLWAVLHRHAVAADQVESSQTRLHPGYRSGRGTRLQKPRVAEYPGCVCMFGAGRKHYGVGWLQLPLIYSVIAVITGNYRASGGNKELLLLRDYPSKTPGRAVTGNYRNSTGIPVTEESVTTRQDGRNYRNEIEKPSLRGNRFRICLVFCCSGQNSS